MLKAFLGPLTALVAMCAMSGASLSQSNQVEGKWNGTLKNWQYDNGNGARDLIVESATSCRWDIAGKPAGPGKAKSCKVTEVNGVVQLELKTGTDSTVNLSLRDGVLDGGFQLKGGGAMYQIMMKRVP